MRGETDSRFVYSCYIVSLSDVKRHRAPLANKVVPRQQHIWVRMLPNAHGRRRCSMYSINPPTSLGCEEVNRTFYVHLLGSGRSRNHIPPVREHADSRDTAETTRTALLRLFPLLGVFLALSIGTSQSVSSLEHGAQRAWRCIDTNARVCVQSKTIADSTSDNDSVSTCP